MSIALSLVLPTGNTRTKWEGDTTAAAAAAAVVVNVWCQDVNSAGSREDPSSTTPDTICPFQVTQPCPLVEKASPPIEALSVISLELALLLL